MRHTECRDKVQNYAEEVKGFEPELEERHRQQMQQEMKAYLEQLDREASKEVLGRGRYESRGLKKRQILTRVGLVEVRVRCYENQRGERIYPLRDICGIGEETEGARRLCVHLAMERPYGWSAELLREEFGLRVGRMKLWEIIQCEGKRAQEQLEQQRARICEQDQAGEEPQGSRIERPLWNWMKR